MRAFWVSLLVVLAALALGGAVRAEEPMAVAEPWQVVITGQIEAFRAHDAPGAFQYAAAPFHGAYPSAEAFFAAIIGSGYAPIRDSSSHSFGKFQQMGEHAVAQQVMLTGTDLSRYEAIYVLTEEAAGWRVSGVQLVKTPGMGV